MSTQRSLECAQNARGGLSLRMQDRGPAACTLRESLTAVRACAAAPSLRVASVQRKTRETRVDVTVGIDGTGKCIADTPVHFLNHMLDVSEPLLLRRTPSVPCSPHCTSGRRPDKLVQSLTCSDSVRVLRFRCLRQCGCHHWRPP